MFTFVVHSKSEVTRTLLCRLGHRLNQKPEAALLVAPGGAQARPASLVELCEVIVPGDGMRPSACAPRTAWVGVLFLLPHLSIYVSAASVSDNSRASAQGPAYRQLQDDGTNTTNTTSESVSACLQEIRDQPGLEQCEIDYREADCDGGNMVSWVTLTGPAIVLYVFGVLTMFLSLSVVCDEFFVPGKALTSPYFQALTSELLI
eukprot:COSAG02_NODE_11201_length_1772_cov_2.138673_1_plen_204_part_00